MSRPYRLGIDIGTNSLGWVALDLRQVTDGRWAPCGFRGSGVRIFSDGRDPQSGASLAVDRRTARGQRRRRDRLLKRSHRLMEALVRYGLMPRDLAKRKTLEALDPYELRARGLDEALPPHHFGRALFHLNQRRGFKSNRRTETAKSRNEDAGMKGAMKTLAAKLGQSDARTLGEYLYVTFRKGRSVRGAKDGSVEPMLPVRARPRVVKNKNEYDLYASRAMYEHEFDALWAVQAKHHAALTEAARQEIHDVIFHQRNLVPVEPGSCTLDPTDKRAPLALPLAQQFRMYQELANLRIERLGEASRSLTKAERDRVYAKLERTSKLNFKKMRSMLALEPIESFNLESEKRDHLKGDQTGIVLAKDGLFGARWWLVPEDRKNAIVEALLAEEDEENVVAMAVTDWGLDEVAARAVANVDLPEEFSRLGRKVLGAIMPIMRDQGLNYADAAKAAGYHHSDSRTGEILDALPYYGESLSRFVAPVKSKSAPIVEREHGRIANPTVHIGLNELRKIVNALIKKYGHPTQIVVELARELKLSREEKKRRDKEQAENQKKNDARRADLKSIGEDDRGDGILRMRLWEELNPKEPHNRRCVYTGEPISINRLFSDEVEIEHILPFKRTLDNSPANKTVSMRWANRIKGNNAPHEAFKNDARFNWHDILLRASDLPKNKKWRFDADAMDRFEKENGFLDRQLVDTQYLARITREYLTRICDPNEVWVTPGRLTQMMRGRWGLNTLLSDHNQKNRTNHKHHAIDAFVVGVTDRAMLQRIARAADQQRERLIEAMPEPWQGFRDELDQHLRALIVSHKPDHGVGGKLHEETAYGIIRDPSKEDGATLVCRKPLADLNPNEIERIRDKALRAEVLEHVAPYRSDKTALKKALTEFRRKRDGAQVKRVRLTKVEESFIKIKGRDAGPYKALIAGDNHHIDIFELPNGRWAGEGVTVFEANQKGFRPRWMRQRPNARLIMRVHKGDLLRLDYDGREQLMRVGSLDASANRLKLSGDQEGGELQKRHDDRDDSFRWGMIGYEPLRKRRARKVTVDVLGRVHDPGPPR